MWWPLTLTYIFKVIWPLLRKSCPLFSVYSFGWILFYILHKWSLCRVLHFQNLEIWIFSKFFKLFGLDLEKIKSTVLDGFFPYVAQMISSIGPLYVTSCYSTWIFCRGVSGFATDCPCDVWCRGLTICLLHVGPRSTFWKSNSKQQCGL